MDPTPGNTKFTAAIIAGAISTIVIYILNTYVLKSGGLPEQIDQSIQTLITAAAVYYAPHSLQPPKSET